MSKCTDLPIGILGDGEVMTTSENTKYNNIGQNL